MVEQFVKATKTTQVGLYKERLFGIANKNLFGTPKKNNYLFREILKIITLMNL